MRDLVYVGEIPSSFDFEGMGKKLFSEMACRSVLEVIGRLLGSRLFGRRARVKNIQKWRDLVVVLNETTIAASVENHECQGDLLINDEKDRNLSTLWLKDIKSLPKYKDGYLLPQTVNTYPCEREIVCHECGGSCECVTCDGEGKVTCPDCQGEKICDACKGYRHEPCEACGYSGLCRNCGGTGRVKGKVIYEVGFESVCGGDRYDNENLAWNDYDGGGRIKSYRAIGYEMNLCTKCHGSGKCSVCRGTRMKKCKVCGGTGTCRKCSGRGIFECSKCGATGRCSKCKNTGRVVCPRCKGTGFYQTFDVISFRQSERRIVIVNEDSEVANTPKAVMGHLYSGIPFRIEFSKVRISDKKLLRLLGRKDGAVYLEKLEEYKNSLVDARNRSKVDENCCIETKVEVEFKRVMKLTVGFAGKRFEFYIVGENGAVYCDRQPSWWDYFVEVIIKPGHKSNI